MPPAAPDDLIRQHTHPIEDDPSLAPDQNQNRQIPEHELSGKTKKKGKSGKKSKGTKAATETPEELYVSQPT